jgi:hypothetical protein
MAYIWRIANPEQCEQVQNMLFESGLNYAPEYGF